MDNDPQMAYASLGSKHCGKGSEDPKTACKILQIYNSYIHINSIIKKNPFK